MDKNYTVVETSKLAAVYGGAHIYSAVSDEDIQNGSIGYIGLRAKNVEGQETYEFGIFDEDTLGKKKAVLVANPEGDYDECHRTNQALYNYINEAGKVFRAYDLIYNDKFALSESGFDTSGVESIEEDQYVILTADSTTLKIVETEDETDGAGFVGIIEGKAKRGHGWTAKNGKTYGRPSVIYWVRVLKNEVVSTAATADKTTDKTTGS